MMSAEKKVKMACACAGTTQAAIASLLNMATQNFFARCRTGKFTIEEWERIATALGAELEFNFVFPDGTKV